MILKDKNGKQINSGDKVDYGFFKNVTVDSFDEKHVILVDKNQNQKKIFTCLFESHATRKEATHENQKSTNSNEN